MVTCRFCQGSVELVENLRTWFHLDVPVPERKLALSTDDEWDTTTSKTAVGLDRGHRPRRASVCKQSRILANIILKLSKTNAMSSFQELQELFL